MFVYFNKYFIFLNFKQYLIALKGEFIVLGPWPVVMIYMNATGGHTLTTAGQPGSGTTRRHPCDNDIPISHPSQ